LWFHSRERPKYQIKEDLEASRNGARGTGDASNTMKVARDPRVEEISRPRSVVTVGYWFFILKIDFFLLTVCNLQQSG